MTSDSESETMTMLVYKVVSGAPVESDGPERQREVGSPAVTQLYPDWPYDQRLLLFSLELAKDFSNNGVLRNTCNRLPGPTSQHRNYGNRDGPQAERTPAQTVGPGPGFLASCTMESRPGASL